jgi:hypothetical protein
MSEERLPRGRRPSDLQRVRDDVFGTLADRVGLEPQVNETGPDRLVLLVPAAAPRPEGLAAAAADLAAAGLAVRITDLGAPARAGPWEVVVTKAP